MIDELDAVLAEAAEEISLPEDNELERISLLAREQLDLEVKIEVAEEELKKLKSDLRRLTTEQIPELMDELNLSEIKTAEGRRLFLRPFYSASIPKGRIPEAMDWLDEHEYGDIIKTTVTLLFGKNELEQAKELAHKFKDQGYNTKADRSVHNQTLRAWVRNMFENDHDFPKDLFGAYIGRTSTIK